LVFGIIEIIGNKLLEILTAEDRNFLNDILTLIYNVNSIPNKIKFKVLDIQDVIKSFNKLKQNIIKSLPTQSISQSFLNSIEKPSIITNLIEHENKDKDDDSFITTPIDIPIAKYIPKINKPVGFSSIKLVQMQSNKTQSEIININNKDDLTKPVVEVSKPVVEVSKHVVEVSKTIDVNTNFDTKKQDGNNGNNRNYNRNRNRNKNGNGNNNSNNKHNDNSNISFNNTTNNSIDDDGFIKIERKSRIINDPQVKSNNNSNNSNNFRQKDKQKNN